MSSFWPIFCFSNGFSVSPIRRRHSMRILSVGRHMLFRLRALFYCSIQNQGLSKSIINLAKMFIDIGIFLAMCFGDQPTNLINLMVYSGSIFSTFACVFLKSESELVQFGTAKMPNDQWVFLLQPGNVVLETISFAKAGGCCGNALRITCDFQLLDG